jgi:hypothetical protein
MGGIRRPGSRRADRARGAGNALDILSSDMSGDAPRLERFHHNPEAETALAQSMIPKSRYRFSEKIMLHQ